MEQEQENTACQLHTNWRPQYSKKKGSQEFEADMQIMHNSVNKEKSTRRKRVLRAHIIEEEN